MKNEKIFIAVFMIICANSTISCKKQEAADPATAPTTYTIGQNYGGGIVFYVDGTGQHGLIAATSNQSASAQWGIVKFIQTFTTGKTVGSGQENTTAIINDQGPGSFAANICDELVLNGYSDWFLPSIDELILLRKAAGKVGGFTVDSYWSSSAGAPSNAWAQSFLFGTQSQFNNNTNLDVRAIRAF